MAEDEDAIGLIEILEQNGALADPERQWQADTRGFMTHVGAVGEVVGAELAHEELIEEGRFVGGAARRVELGHVRVRQRCEMPADGRESLVPAYRQVAVTRSVVGHRVREPARHLEFVITPALEFGDGVLGEELRRAALGR